MMRINRQIIASILLLSFLVSCSPRKKPVDPVEPSTPGPGVIQPTEPSPVEPVEPPSTEPPKQTPAPPAPKPRQPSRGDLASTKLVENGAKLMNAGDLESAEQMFEQALRVSPTNGRPYYYLGVVAAKRKEYERSLGFLTQAEVYLKDDDFWMSQVCLQQGYSLKALGRKAEARARFQEAIRYDPTNQWAQSELNNLK